MLAVLGYFGRRYSGELDRIAQAPPWILACILVAYFVTRALNGQVMRVLMRPLGYALRFGEAWMLVLLTTYANLLVPRAGLGMPAIYLKAKHGVRYADFGSQSLIATVLQIVCIGAMGLTCEAVLAMVYGIRAPGAVTAIFAAALVGGLVLTFLRLPSREEPKGKVGRTLHRLAVAWALMGNPRTVLLVLAWNVPMLLLRAWRVQLSFYAVGQPVTFAGALIASLMGDMAFFVSVTPAALGIREAAITYTAPVLGTTREVALAASVLDRIVWTIAVVLVAQVGMWRMLRPVYKQRAAMAGASEE